MAPARQSMAGVVGAPVAGPTRERYDVIVIGGGIGGLTAGALLAKAGLDVVVVERGATAGGYARPRQLGAYTFDPAVGTLSDPGLFGGLLAHLGVADRCDLIGVDTLYDAHSPDFRVTLPVGNADAFIEAQAAAIPEAAQEIRAFFTTCLQIHLQAHALPQSAGLHDIDRLVAEQPMAFAHRRSTVADVVAQTVTDPRAATLCGMGSLLLGLPPSRLSIQTFAQSIMTYVADGSFVFRGGAGTFVNALIAALQRDDGEIAVSSPVTGITVAEGRADGIVLADGRVIRGRHVVSNADASATFRKLLPKGDRPAALLRKIGRLSPGSSAVVLNAATTASTAGADGASMVVSTGRDIEASYVAAAQGYPQAVVLRLPSRVDPGLAPAGEHVLSAWCATPMTASRPWAELAPTWEAALLAAADRLAPGLAQGVCRTDLMTPETLRDLAHDDHGTTFGWELTPAAAGAARPAPRTPVPGLYLAGKWSQPGGCFLRSTVSGVFASQVVMGDAGMRPEGSFEHPLLPSLD